MTRATRWPAAVLLTVAAIGAWSDGRAGWYPGGTHPRAAEGAAATTAYAVGTAELRKDPAGSVVGTVTPGTPVAVTETQGGNAHVAVHGWFAAGSNAIVSAVGLRIVLVNLTAPDQAQRETGSQTKDSYGTVWTEVTVSGWMAPAALTADVQTVWTRGRQSYESHCSTCHSLYASDQYTANQWPGLLSNMSDRAGLSGADLALVLKYLQTHAKAP